MELQNSHSELAERSLFVQFKRCGLVPLHSHKLCAPGCLQDICSIRLHIKNMPYYCLPKTLFFFLFLSSYIIQMGLHVSFIPQEMAFILQYCICEESMASLLLVSLCCEIWTSVQASIEPLMLTKAVGI